MMIPLLFGTSAALLVLAAAGLYLRRLFEQRRGETSGLSDAMVQRIEETGRLELDEPLDLDHIRDEEARFWEGEPWEEPDEL